MIFDKFKFWKLIFECVTWYLISENCCLNKKFVFWIFKITICNKEVIFQSKFLYLIIKFDISFLNILIWISEMIFQIKKLLFEFGNSYLKKKLFLVFKNWYFNLEIDIWISKKKLNSLKKYLNFKIGIWLLNFFIWIWKLMLKSQKIYFWIWILIFFSCNWKW